MAKKKRGSNWDKWFLLSWKKAWIIVVSGFLGIILHNAFYAIFEVEEAVFLIIVVFILPIYFITSVFYTILKKLKKGGKK